MKIGFQITAAAIVLIMGNMCPGETVKHLREIVPDNIGEFVTVSGKVAAYYPPPEPRAPYAFLLEDDNGDHIRVVTWPDIYERVDNHKDLQTTGTLVRLKAEVVEYNEHMELHVEDWEEIDVTPTSGTAALKPTLPGTAIMNEATTATAAEGTTATSITSPGESTALAELATTTLYQ